MVGIKDAPERYFEAVEEPSPLAFGRAGARENRGALVRPHAQKVAPIAL